MKKILGIFILFSLTALNVFAEDWKSVNNIWEYDKDSIIESGDVIRVMVRQDISKLSLQDKEGNLLVKEYYYTKYSPDKFEKKIINSKKINNLGKRTDYKTEPKGIHPEQYTKDSIDYTIVNQIINKDNEQFKNDINPPNIDFNKLVFIKCIVNVTTEVSPRHRFTSTHYFYIDDKNKQVYNEYKRPVKLVKTFTDQTLEFLSESESNSHRYHNCYTIDRYTGRIDYYMFSYSKNIGGKVLDLYTKNLGSDLYATGSGQAEREIINYKKF